MKFIFPTKAAKENAMSGFTTIPEDAEKIILPHVELCDLNYKKRKVNTSIKNIKVAFIGSPVEHKGWEEFKILTSIPKISNHVDWYHYGKGNVGKPIESKYFDGTQKDNASLVETMRKDDIDIALIWPLWQETFCFTAFEAVYAGCHIVTNSRAGNVTSGGIPESCRSIFNGLEEMVDFFDKLCDGENHYLYALESAKYSESNYSLNFLK